MKIFLFFLPHVHGFRKLKGQIWLHIRSSALCQILNRGVSFLHTAMSTDEWFGQLLSSDESPKPEEVQALQAFLAGNISSVHAAAEKFTAVAARAGNSSEEIGDALYRMWKLVIDVAQNFPETQDKLVELLTEVENLPDLERDGHTFIHHGMKVWNDLPTFGWEMRERWNCELRSAVFSGYPCNIRNHART